MKVTAYEMTKPMAEDQEYYSNYDAFEKGWVNENNQHWSSNYNLSNTSDVKNFQIYLNKPYTKDGKTYNNYGSYILQTYAKHPEYFKTNYKFLYNVCPGFYIKNVGGTGNMGFSNLEYRAYLLQELAKRPSRQRMALKIVQL